MTQKNTIKAAILSVLIITGSAMSSEASSGSAGAIASVMSGIMSLAVEAVLEMHSFVTDGPGASMLSIGG